MGSLVGGGVAGGRCASLSVFALCKSSLRCPSSPCGLTGGVGASLLRRLDNASYDGGNGVSFLLCV